MGKPYHDPDTLRRMYAGDGMTQAAIADEFGVSQSTIYLQLKKHGIERSKPWRDADTLRRLYWEEGKSLTEVADELGCSKEPVARAMRELEVERRTPPSKRAPTLYTTANGYVEWKHEHDGDRYGVYVHRLLAVAEHGFDAVAGNDIHHKNGVSWDNRPANLEPIDHADHASKHHSD